MKLGSTAPYPVENASRIASRISEFFETSSDEVVCFGNTITFEQSKGSHDQHFQL